MRPRARLASAALVAVLAVASGCAHRLSAVREPVEAAGPLVENVPRLVFDDDACGAGSLWTLLQVHGRDVTHEELERELRTDRKGRVLSLELMLAARRHGLDARWVVGDGASLARELAVGAPPVLMLQVLDMPGRRRDLFHFAVATGLDEPRALVRLLIGDGEERWVPLARLERAWRRSDHAMMVARPARDERRPRHSQEE